MKVVRTGPLLQPRKLCAAGVGILPPALRSGRAQIGNSDKICCTSKAHSRRVVVVPPVAASHDDDGAGPVSQHTRQPTRRRNAEFWTGLVVVVGTCYMLMHYFIQPRWRELLANTSIDIVVYLVAIVAGLWARWPWLFQGLQLLGRFPEYFGYAAALTGRVDQLAAAVDQLPAAWQQQTSELEVKVESSADKREAKMEKQLASIQQQLQASMQQQQLEVKVERSADKREANLEKQMASIQQQLQASMQQQQQLEVKVERSADKREAKMEKQLASIQQQQQASMQMEKTIQKLDNKVEKLIMVQIKGGGTKRSMHNIKLAGKRKRY